MAQPGATSFAALVEPAAAKSIATESRTGIARNVLSFDAPGMLGLGGPTMNGPTAAGSMPKAGKARRGAEDLIAPVPTPGAVPQATRPAMPAVHSATDAVDVSAAGPTNTRAAPSTPVEIPHERAPAAASGLHGVLQGATPRSSAAIEPATGAPSLPETSGAPLLARAFTNLRAQAPQIDEVVSARKTTAPRFEPEGDTSSGEISVVLSETEDGLNIAASTPDLSDNDKHILKRVVEDAVGDTGLAFGELRLNGVAIRSFSKIS
jgi:hypothetical protein